MIRKSLIVILAVFSLITLAIGIASRWHVFHVEGALTRYLYVTVSVRDTTLGVAVQHSKDPWLIALQKQSRQGYWDYEEENRELFAAIRRADLRDPLLEFDFCSNQKYTVFDTKRNLNVAGSTTNLRMPTWAPGMFFALIPLVAIAINRHRRRRRWRKGRCSRCGYDLTANETGICSECGSPVAACVPSYVRPLAPFAGALAVLAIALILVRPDRNRLKFETTAAAKETPIAAENSPADARTAIQPLLRYGPLKKKAAQRINHYASNEKLTNVQTWFTGTLLTLPADLEDRAFRFFPELRFDVAKMIPDPNNGGSANLLLISKRNTGEVIAHVFDLRFAPTSESFGSCFSEYEYNDATSPDERARTLAELIAFTTNSGKSGCSIGDVNNYGRWIRVRINFDADSFRPESYTNLDLDIGGGNAISLVSFH